MKDLVKSIRSVRKNQIKRIKNHEIGTRNSMLYLNHLAELRNVLLFTNRLNTVFNDLILNPDEGLDVAEKSSNDEIKVE